MSKNTTATVTDVERQHFLDWCTLKGMRPTVAAEAFYLADMGYKPSTSFPDRRTYGIPYGPMSNKDAKSFAKSAGSTTGALLVEVRGKGTYVGFMPSPEFVTIWMAAENVKSVTALLAKKA